jgi:hypothetical protein
VLVTQETGKNVMTTTIAVKRQASPLLDNLLFSVNSKLEIWYSEKSHVQTLLGDQSTTRLVELPDTTKIFIDNIIDLRRIIVCLTLLRFILGTLLV